MVALFGDCSVSSEMVWVCMICKCIFLPVLIYFAIFSVVTVREPKVLLILFSFSVMCIGSE